MTHAESQPPFDSHRAWHADGFLDVARAPAPLAPSVIGGSQRADTVADGSMISQHVGSEGENCNGSGDELIGGRYRRIRRVGAGSQAVVWECEDVVTSQRVACKSYAMAQAPMRDIAAEVRSLEIVGDHPNIVRLHDVIVGRQGSSRACGVASGDTGGTADRVAEIGAGVRAGNAAEVGNSCKPDNSSSAPNPAAASQPLDPSIDTSVHVLMELVPGDDLLTEILQRGPLAEPLASALFRQLASAVAYCHASGVMHRDIKPDNVLLLRPPDSARGGPRIATGPATGHATGCATSVAAAMGAGTATEQQMAGATERTARQMGGAAAIAGKARGAADPPSVEHPRGLTPSKAVLNARAAETTEATGAMIGASSAALPPAGGGRRAAREPRAEEGLWGWLIGARLFPSAAGRGANSDRLGAQGRGGNSPLRVVPGKVVGRRFAGKSTRVHPMAGEEAEATLGAALTAQSAHSSSSSAFSSLSSACPISLAPAPSPTSVLPSPSIVSHSLSRTPAPSTPCRLTITSGGEFGERRCPLPPASAESSSFSAVGAGWAHVGAERGIWGVKLADFALSTVVTGGMRGAMADRGAGTRQYMAPEILLLEVRRKMARERRKGGGGDVGGKGDAIQSEGDGGGAGGAGGTGGAGDAGCSYGMKADVWSMGITLCSMLTGRLPIVKPAKLLAMLHAQQQQLEQQQQQHVGWQQQWQQQQKRQHVEWQRREGDVEEEMGRQQREQGGWQLWAGQRPCLQQAASYEGEKQIKQDYHRQQQQQQQQQRHIMASQSQNDHTQAIYSPMAHAAHSCTGGGPSFTSATFHTVTSAHLHQPDPSLAPVDMNSSLHIDFESPGWKPISAAAKDLIRRMLCINPDQRLSSLQVLEHPWLNQGSVRSRDLAALCPALLFHAPYPSTSSSKPSSTSISTCTSTCSSTSTFMSSSFKMAPEMAM